MLLYCDSVWTSPYVLSCFVALREKKLPFEVQTIALDLGAQRDPSFTKPSLTARVPMLVDGDFSLSESSAIVEYIEEAYPPPAHARLLPLDVRARARARQIMAWVRSDLMPIREERSAEYVFYSRDRLKPFAPLSPAGERAANKLLAAAEQIIPADAGPIHGEWCIADTDLAMMLQRLVKTAYGMSDKVRAYADRQWQRPSVREFMDQERPSYERAVP
jgi:glutathione S-transferase